MMMNNRQGFATLINKFNFTTGIEIGVRYGWYSHFLLHNCPQLTMYCVDCWEENPENGQPHMSYLTAIENLQQFVDANRCVLHKGWSPKAVNKYRPNFFDFIYIDAQHDYESVKADLFAWWPTLKENGIFAGHDYSMSDWPGVVQAVNEFAAKVNRRLHLTGIGDKYGETDGNQPSWYMFK